METEFLELNARAVEDGRAYPKKRAVWQTINNYCREGIFLALVGPRGAGKTVLLKQMLSQSESAFYVSLDTQKPEEGLFGLAKELSERGVKLLLLDEVHAYPGFDGELKKISDFLKMDVVLTSSSSISLHESAYDLSRRVRIIKIPSFSLREFAFFEKNEALPPLAFEEMMKYESAREYYGRVISVEGSFERYLQGRNYPFAIGKSDVLPLFKSILEKIIQNDIILSGRASPEEALEIRRTLGFVGSSPVEDISYSSVAKNLGITKYKAEKYVELMEKAFVLKRIFPKGSNVTKEPKILLSLPYRLLYRDYKECIGALREDFFVEAFTSLGFELNYLKTARGRKTPDYLAGKTIFEIGGASKGVSQFEGYKGAKKIILTHPGRIDEIRRPLFFAGMLEAKQA